MKRLTLAALAALALALAVAPSAFASFGFRPGPAGFQVTPVGEGGAPDLTSGSHPYELTTKIALNVGSAEPEQHAAFTDGDIRNLTLELPPGLFENPAAPGVCKEDEFQMRRISPFEASASGESCPDKSQVGTVTVQSSAAGGSTRTFGVFNLQPPPGVPAEIGFAPYGDPIVFATHIRPAAAGEYALSLEARNIPQSLDIYGLEMTIWGTPWGPSHNGERGNCLNEQEPGFGWAKCSVGPPTAAKPLAYLTLPTACEGPLSFVATATSWQGGPPAQATSQSTDSEGSPAPLKGCSELEFDSQADGGLISNNSSSPAGLAFDVTNNNEALTAPLLRVPSQVRDAVVTLPEKVTLNPSLGAGLKVCLPGQYAVETASSVEGAGCPNESKIGDFTVQSPLFAEAMKGAIYLAQSNDKATAAHGAENPFDALIAVYLVARAPNRGVLVKVAGKIEPNLQTGQLVATFQDLPQLPYENMHIHFREGNRAPLVTPDSCGTYAIYSNLIPWQGALGSLVRKSFSTISAGPYGSACPTGPVPFGPGAKGGTLNSNAGAYSPYYLHLTRSDIDQEITSYSTFLPPGLLGSIKGIPLCPDSAIAEASRKTGIEEREHPSCPAASKVGYTSAGYGVGPVLTYAPGGLYLGGPYHGQPFSLVAVDSALVGPFDLGVVIVRSAIKVDPQNAQISIDSAGSDPIPHIIDGIPIHLRDIRIYINRPQMMVNPTSCQPFTMVSTMTGSAPPFANPKDVSAAVPDHFQVSNCGSLGFRPDIRFNVNASRRGAFPALKTTVKARSGDANFSGAVVTLPHTEFLAQGHIRNLCTRVQFAASNCPAKSVYGRAKVTTPLLSDPMTGLVYLRSSTNKNGLPDMVVDLHGAGVTIDLVGKISSPHGGLQAHFSGLPDAPIETFSLTMFGGKRGLLQNSTNLCSARSYVEVQLFGQSNQLEKGGRRLKPRCGGRHKGGKKHHKRHDSHRRRTR